MKNKLIVLMLASFFSSYACVAMDSELSTTSSNLHSRALMLQPFEQSDMEVAKTTLLKGTLTKSGDQAQGFIHNGSLYQLIKAGITANQKSIVEMVGQIDSNNEIIFSGGKIIVLHGRFVRVGFDGYGHPFSHKYTLLPQVEEQIPFGL